MAINEDKLWRAQSDQGKQFLHDLRKYMRDNEEINTLLDEEEIDESSLVLAVKMSVSDYNMQPPLLSSQNFVAIVDSGLFAPMLRLSAANILEMKYQSQERNRLQYSDGNRTEVINDKAPDYKDTANRLRQMAMTTIANYKQALNLKRGYGSTSGIHSEYAYINDWI